jgi:hypothetical protein
MPAFLFAPVCTIVAYILSLTTVVLIAIENFQAPTSMPTKTAESKTFKGRMMAVPRKTLPYSSLRGICIYKSYIRDEDPGVRKVPWPSQDDLELTINVDACDASERGFIVGKKLEHHGLVESITGWSNNVFPRCWGKNTIFEKDAVRPQYGSIKDIAHERTGLPDHNTLRVKRQELNHRMRYKRSPITDPTPGRRVCSCVVGLKTPLLNAAIAEGVERDLEIIDQRRKEARDRRRRQRRELMPLMADLEGAPAPEA